MLQRILPPSTARRLGFWVLLGSVCVLAACLAFVVVNARAAVQRRSTETLTALAGASATAVAARTGTVEMTARIIAATIGRRLNSPEFIETLLTETVVAHDDISGVAAAFEPGTVSGEAQRYAPFYIQDNGSARRRDLADDPGSYLDSTWYRKAVACARGCWGQVFHSQSRDQTLINFGVPIRDAGNRVVGVVNVDIQQRWLQRLIDHVRPGPASIAFLLGEDGVLLADVRPERIGKSIFELAAKTGTTELDGIARRMLAGEAGSAAYLSPTLGIPVRTFFTPIPDSHWSLGLVVPYDTYVRDAQTLFIEIVAIGSIGLAALGLFVGFAVRRVLAPLADLAVRADHVARGELGFHLDPPPRMDEVGRLTQSFIRMRDELRQHIAELTDATAARQRLQSELEIAQHIQESMLPSGHYLGLGAYPFELQAVLRPARVVGGDMYSYVSRGDSRLCFLIGDVSDKGIPAALFMARTITSANSRARSIESPEELLRQLNVELCAGNDDCMFVTMLCGILDLSSGRMVLASAGHDPPIRLAGGDVSELAVETSSPLGLDPEAIYPRSLARMSPGETLVLFTDGVTEALAPDGAFYGKERLLAMIRQSQPEPAVLISAIVADVAGFAGDAPPADDLTLLALRWHGPRPPSDFKLELRAELSEVGAYLDRLERWLVGHHVDAETRGDVRVALEELLVNTVSYGFPDGREKERLRTAVAIDAGVLRAELEDNGIACDPFARPAPDLDAAHDDREPGGLGVYLVTQLATEYRYRRDGGCNRVELCFALRNTSANGSIER